MGAGELPHGSYNDGGRPEARGGEVGVTGEEWGALMKAPWIYGSIDVSIAMDLWI